MRNENRSSSDVIECDVDVPCIPPPPPPLPAATSTDFLLPVHIRQTNLATHEILPVLDRWHLIDSEELDPSDRLKNFFRICPTNDENHLDENHPQVTNSNFSPRRIDGRFRFSSFEFPRNNGKWNYFANTFTTISVLTLNRRSIGRRCSNT